MMIDMDHVSGLIRAAVEAKILPRFRNLAAGDVAEKGPNDPVTIADIEGEEMLSRLLVETYPGTLVVGEGLASRDPVGGGGTGVAGARRAGRAAGRHAGLGDGSGGRDAELLGREPGVRDDP